jgi:hypothetical protein
LVLADFIFKRQKYRQLRVKKKGLLESSPLFSIASLAIQDVHRDFKAKAHFGVSGLGPHV